MAKAKSGKRKKRTPEQIAAARAAAAAKLDSLRQRKFLAAFAKVGIITTAAKLAKVDRRQHPRWNAAPGPAGDAYRAAFEEAKEEACERLEEVARTLAKEGHRRLVVHDGEPVFISVDKDGNVVPPGTVGSRQVPLYETKHNATLIIFLLKNLNPDKFGERSHINLSGNVQTQAPIEKVVQECLAALKTPHTEPAGPDQDE